VIYFLLTVIYSISIKKKIIIDIIVLSIFYTIRIYAGSQATGIFISTWLLTFSIFFFFSLATVKRQTELIFLSKNRKTNIKGRGYKITDLPIINIMAVCSGYLSIVILAFYINSEEVIELYSNPDFLWGVCFVLLYWITRIIFVASRGLMHFDPIIYASKDKESYICLIMILFFITSSVI
jgi:4-hydroxybenzoate polyprenyltransferase